MSGSSLHIDPETINAMLKAFADQPGGPSFTFQDGRLVVRALSGTAISFIVDHVTVSPQGIDVGIRIAR